MIFRRGILMWIILNDDWIFQIIDVIIWHECNQRFQTVFPCKDNVSLLWVGITWIWYQPVCLCDSGQLQLRPFPSARFHRELSNGSVESSVDSKLTLVSSVQSPETRRESRISWRNLACRESRFSICFFLNHALECIVLNNELVCCNFQKGSQVLWKNICLCPEH